MSSTAASGGFSSTGLRDGREQQVARLLLIDPTGTAKWADRVTS